MRHLCLGASSVFKAKIVGADTVDVFDSKTVPSIDIGEYLMRVAYYIPLTKQQFLLGIEYIDRYLISLNTSLSATSIHRLTATAMVLAHKFDCDYPLNDTQYGKIMGLNRHELMELQMEFMRRVQYRLMYPDVLREFPPSEEISRIGFSQK
jgi:hypothetical protein